MGALDDGERVEAKDAAAWRAWLSEHHLTARGAWLARPRPGSGLDLVGYEDAILQELCFGWIDGPVAQLEEAGLLEAAGIRAIEVAKVNGAWHVLDNAEALGEPDNLAAALDAVPAARAAWDTFPPSARKAGIASVDTARRPETRAARILTLVSNAAEGRRP